jgi:hypothetical protein
MATLQATTVASSITANSSTIWHAGNDGAGTSLNVQFLWGYAISHFDVQVRTTALDLTSGSRTKFWPMIFNQNGWGNGIMELSVRKGSVHQGGSGAGALYGRFRYRATAWGHHSTFWEMEDNWGGGFNYPYIAGYNNLGQTTNDAVIWLRGETLYYFTWNNPFDGFTNTAIADNKTVTEPNGSQVTWSSREDVFVPGNSRYLQKHVCGKSGFSLGQSSYRWATVFAVAENASSDARLKEDIGDSLGSEFLRKLKPKSYRRVSSYYTNDDHSPVEKYPDGAKRSVGFIAQDVKAVMDSMNIAEKDFGGYDGSDPNHLSLRYTEFIPVLVKSLQEKSAKIKNLKKRINNLRGQ